MCEVWKWIAIVLSIPILGVLIIGATKWRMESMFRWFAWWKPYQRFWWLGVFVFAFSLVIYVAHCTD